MTLAKALKIKNRLTQKITRLQQEIQRENSARLDDPRKIDVEKSMTELKETIQELIRIKITIFIASTPMRENILKLSELKSEIVFIQSIDTKEGKISDYTGKETEYSVAYDKIWVKESVESCEKEIDSIQEELDKFNHTTEIEI